jgi:hypothetical protein
MIYSGEFSRVFASENNPARVTLRERCPNSDHYYLKKAAAKTLWQVFACLFIRRKRRITSHKLCGKAALKAVDNLACELLKTLLVDN